MIEILLQAERALSLGLLDQAEKLYRQVAEADPRNSIAVVGLARVALERGEDSESLALGRRALEIDPENSAAQRLVQRLEEVRAYREARDVPVEGQPEAPVTAATPAPAATPEPSSETAESPEAGAGPVAKTPVRPVTAAPPDAEPRAGLDTVPAPVRDRDPGVAPPLDAAPQAARTPTLEPVPLKRSRWRAWLDRLLRRR